MNLIMLSIDSLKMAVKKFDVKKSYYYFITINANLFNMS